MKAQMAIRHHVDDLLNWDGVLIMPTALGPPPALETVIAPEYRGRLVALGSIAGLCGLPQVLNPITLPLSSLSLPFLTSSTESAGQHRRTAPALTALVRWPASGCACHCDFSRSYFFRSYFSRSYLHALGASMQLTSYLLQIKELMENPEPIWHII